MRKAIFSFVLLVSFAASVLGQQSVTGTNTANALKPATSTPTGACYRNQVRINVSTVYICPQSGTATWTAVSGGGGGGIGTGDSPTLTGVWTWSLANAAAVSIGPNGNTNPTLRVVTNVASAATGLSITGNAAGSGVTLSALSSGTNENINYVARGTGNHYFNGTVDPSIHIQATLDSSIDRGMFIKASGGSIRAQFTANNSTGEVKIGAIGGGGFYPSFYTNNVQAAIIDSNKRLGVNKFSSLAAQVDVISATVGVPAAQFQAASGESATVAVISGKDGAGVERFKVQNNGRIYANDASGNAYITNAAGHTARLSATNFFNANAFISTTYVDAVTFQSNFDTYLTRAAAANWRSGAADVNGTPVSQRNSVQNAITGSNLPGSTRHFDGSVGTGSGNGGDIDFNVALPGAGATTQNTLVPALIVKGNNGDVYLPQSGSAVGVVLKSPDGTCYRITVANGGTLTTASITCP